MASPPPADADFAPPPPRPIAALPPDAAHRVASGQAVLDLAGAVKELLENAVDAGATTVEVRLTESGSELIEVADNGHGITPADRPALARKHHTSKLAAFEDLEGVTTFGFRGEALSSLCALAEGVGVVTRTPEEAAAARLAFDSAGELVSSEPAARAPGTTVAVRRLFAPLPVRRRELARTLRREYGRALALLQAYAIKCTTLRLVVTNQVGTGPRTTAVSTTAGSSVLANFGSLFGPKAAAGLTPLAFALPGGGRATGYVSSASADRSRAGGERQFFYVHGRPVDLPRAARALNDAYRALGSPATAGCRPAAVLDFELPAGRWDVNAAPDKRRAMLAGEDALVAALADALKELWEPSRAAYAVAGALLPAKRLRAGRRPADAEGAGDSDDDGDDSNGEALQPAASPSGTAAARTRGRQLAALSPAAPSPRPRTEMGRELERFALGARHPPATAPIAARRLPASAPAHVPPPLPARPVRGERRDQPTLAAYVVRTTAPSPKRRRGAAAAAEVRPAEEEGEKEDGEKEEEEEEGEAEQAPAEADAAVDAGGAEAHAASSPAQALADEPSGTALTAHAAELAAPAGDEPPNTRVPSSPATQAGAPPVIQAGVPPATQAMSPPPAGGQAAASPKLTDDQMADVPSSPPLPDAAPSSSTPPAFTVAVDMADLARRFRARWAADDAAAAAPARAVPARAAAFHEATLVGQEGETGPSPPPPPPAPSDAPLPLADAPDAAGAELERVFTRSEFLPLSRGVIGHFNLGFILARLGDDLFIVDQHASDEKANFERLEREADVGRQPLLAPARLGLAPSEANAVRDNIDAFHANGFDFVESPAGELLLAAAPTLYGSVFGPADVRELAATLAAPAAGTRGSVPRPPRLRAALAMRACRSSIMVGRPLSKPEMTRVVARLATLDSPWNCPHGRPTMRHLAVLPPAEGGGG